MIAFLLMISLAFAKKKNDDYTLLPGEFYTNARTLKAHTFAFHPYFYRSVYGLGDRVDVKFPVLGLLAGPAASLEVGAIEAKNDALSIEPSAGILWSFNSWRAGARVRYTHDLGRSRFDLGSGALWRAGHLGDQLHYHQLAIPAQIGFDLVPSKTTTWQVLAQTNVNGLFDGFATGSLNANWSHGWKKFRFQGGLWIFVVSAPELPSILDLVPGLPEDGVVRDVLDEAESQLYEGAPKFAVIPVPDIAIWWRF